MNKTKFFRAVILILTILVLVAATAFSFGCKKDKEQVIDDSKPMLPTTEYPDDKPEEEKPDNTPEDPGPLADHVFQAESAFNGVSTASNKPLGGLCMAQSFFFDLSFGDSVIVRNVTQANKNKYIYRFESSAAYKCTLEVAVASAFDGSEWVERNLSAMFETSVNGDVIDGDVTVPAATSDQVKGGNNYTCIQNVEVPITIREGSNTLVMEVLAGVCNLDYINIKTSAEISGFEPKWWDDDTVVTIDLPTTTEAGTINLACTEHGKSNTFTLPALTAENGYEVSGDGQSFSFPFNGETYTIKADGTYEFPEGTVVDGETEPEPEPDDEVQDPDADPLPEVQVNGKDFFEPSNWTKFASGDAGAQPVEMNSALKFKDAARFDFFYVAGSGKNVHLGDKSDTLDDQGVYNKEYSWTLEMSSKGSFDMIMFATANLPSAYGQSGSAGVYLSFEESKISVKNAYYGSETTSPIAEAPVSLTLDGETKFKVKITVNRVDASTLTFKIAIGDQALTFTAGTASTAGASVSGETVTLGIGSGSYGQRIAFVPATNSIVRVYGLTLPE